MCVNDTEHKIKTDKNRRLIKLKPSHLYNFLAICERPRIKTERIPIIIIVIIIIK